MTDELDNKTDAQLNELFAVEVVGWQKSAGSWFRDSKGRNRNSLNFCTDANAVLPWLGNTNWRGYSNGFSGSDMDRYPHYTIFVTERAQVGRPERFGIEHKGDCFDGGSILRSFARAAVLALLRAKRAEKQ